MVPSLYSCVRKCMRRARSSIPKFDLNESDKKFRAFCKKRGVDLDKLLAGASRHFNSPIPVPRSTPLTKEELKALVEDDMRAFPITPKRKRKK